MVGEPVMLAVLTAICGAFAWCATQIEGLKKDLAIALKSHRECEQARTADALEMLRMRYAIESLGRTTGTTDTIDRVLNKPKPPIPDAEQAGKETVMLSEGIPKPSGGEAR